MIWVSPSEMTKGKCNVQTQLQQQLRETRMSEWTTPLYKESDHCKGLIYMLMRPFFISSPALSPFARTLVQKEERYFLTFQHHFLKHMEHWPWPASRQWDHSPLWEEHALLWVSAQTAWPNGRTGRATAMCWRDTATFTETKVLTPGSSKTEGI